SSSVRHDAPTLVQIHIAYLAAGAQAGGGAAPAGTGFGGPGSPTIAGTTEGTVRSLIAVFVLGSLALADAADGGRALDPRASERLEMVQRYLVSEGIRDQPTLEAMRSVPRHEFVPS